MDPGPARDLSTASRGFTTIQFVVAVGLSLLVVSAITNFIVFQYGRGVVRNAVDDGARAGALEAPDDAHRVAACERRARQAIRDLLRGELGDGVEIRCRMERDGEDVLARARVRFTSWFPGVPDWHFAVSARAATEGVR